MIAMEIVEDEPKKLGRPLSFDRAKALEQAMLVFWRSGYETSSIADLTAAMGITPPSLYTAFGSKQQLFLEAVRLYAGDPETTRRALDEAETAFAGARDLLTAAAMAFTGETTPRGCLLASAAASGSEASADVRRAVAEVRRGVMAALEARIVRDIALGALPPGTSAQTLAGLVMAVMQGMSVLARDGLSRKGLLAIAAEALDGWPDGPKALEVRHG